MSSLGFRESVPALFNIQAELALRCCCKCKTDGILHGYTEDTAGYSSIGIL